MNQASILPIGSDANLLAGYAFAANDRLGTIDVVMENVGANSAYVQIREFDGTTSPSGYKNVGAAVTIVPKGTTTVHMNLLTKQIGFFGSGNTVLNVSTAMRNPANLRGAQIDIVPIGRKGWGYDDAFDKKAFRSPGWGAAPDAPTAPVDGY